MIQDTVYPASLSTQKPGTTLPQWPSLIHTLSPCCLLVMSTESQAKEPVPARREQESIVTSVGGAVEEIKATGGREGMWGNLLKQSRQEGTSLL